MNCCSRQEIGYDFKLEPAAFLEEEQHAGHNDRENQPE
jgi:hypothetical protein